MSTAAAPEVWTVKRILEWTRGHFEKQQVDSARLTAEILLAHTLKLTRVKLYVEHDRPLSKDELAAFKALIQRRMTGEPTQYLVGSKEFYGRTFSGDPRVLSPRPETELLVEAVLRDLPKDEPRRVLDVCTGSGCIAISIAAERPKASVWATDVSAEALELAAKNAEALQVGPRVTFRQGDLFAAIPPDMKFDVIVSNPPYIRRDELKSLQREVQKEPTLALDGGPDGLDFYRRILETALSHLKSGGLLAFEIGDEQGAAVSQLMARSGCRDVRVEKDLAPHDRLVLGRAPSE